jgi:hypothetical protein
MQERNEKRNLDTEPLSNANALVKPVYQTKKQLPKGDILLPRSQHSRRVQKRPQKDTLIKLYH